MATKVALEKRESIVNIYLTHSISDIILPHFFGII